MTKQVVYLLETQPYNPDTASVVAVNFSAGLLEETVSGASAAYPVRLSTAFSHEVSVFSDNIPGSSSTSIGSIVINNVDGRFDYLLNYNWDNRVLTVKKGFRGDAYGTFTNEFLGRSLQLATDGTNLILSIKDNSAKLAVFMQPLKYAGSGGAEGGGDLKGRRKPLALGDVRNASPVIVDATKLTMQFSSTTLVGITRIYDNAVPLTFSANYASYALLIAAVIAPGSYATCLATGFIRLGAPPAGTITGDLRGIHYSDDIGTQTIEFIKAQTGLVNGDFNTGSFTTLNSDFSYDLEGMYFEEPDFQADQFLDIIAGSVNGFWYVTRAGLIKISQFKFATPVATVREEDLVGLSRVASPSPIHRVSVNYSKNPTVQEFSQLDIPRQAFNGYLTRPIEHIATAGDGSGGTYTTDAIFKVYLDGSEINSYGFVTFAVITTSPWVTINSVGVVSITDPGATTATATLRANLGEMNLDFDFTVTRSLGTLKEVSLSPDRTHILIDDQGNLIGNQDVVVTATVVGTTLTGVIAVDNLGNSLALTGSNPYTLDDALIVTSPLVQYITWVFSDVAGIKQTLRTNVRRGIDSYSAGIVEAYTPTTWANVSNPAGTKPSDNAGTSGTLTAIGTFSTIVGNSVGKVGGTHGAEQGGAVARLIPRSSIISSSMLFAGAGGAWQTRLALDDDNTTFTLATQKYAAVYDSGGIAGGGTVTLYKDGSAVAGPLTLTGVGISSRLWIGYNGFKIIAGVNNQTVETTSGVTSGMSFYPKVLDFHAAGASAIYDIQHGAWAENAWVYQGGPGLPASNAGTTLQLTALGSGTLSITGNSVTRTDAGAAWNTNTVSKEFFIGTAAVSARLPSVGTFFGLTDTTTISGGNVSQSYYELNYSFHRSSNGNWYIYESGAEVLNMTTVYNGVTFSSTTTFFIIYDGVTVKYYADGVLMRTVATTANRVFYAGTTLNPLSSTITDILFYPYTQANFSNIGGATRPSDYAGTTVDLVASNVALTIVGNGVRNTTTTEYTAYDKEAQVGTAVFSFTVVGAALNNVNQYIRGGLVSAANRGVTGETGIGHGFFIGANLYLYVGGAYHSTGPTPVNGDRYTITYDGVNIRYYRTTAAGVTTLLLTYATTAGQTLYANVAASGIGYGVSEVRVAPYTDNAWASVAGTGKPSDNAGTSGILVAIGTNTIVAGNSVIKTGGTHGAFEGGAVGMPMVGTAYIRSSLLRAAAGGGWDTYLSLDDDATSFTLANQKYAIRYYASGAGSGHLYLYKDGTAIDNVAVPVTTDNSRLWIGYDGVKIIGGVGTVTLSTTSGVSAGTTYYPKVIDYYVSVGTAPSGIIDVLYGPFTDNAWSTIGGTGKPADNASKDISLTTSSNVVSAGNTLIAIGGGVAYTSEPLVGNAMVTGRVGTLTGSVEVSLTTYALRATYVPDHNAGYFSIQPNAGGTTYWVHNGAYGTDGMGSHTIGDQYTITYDGVSANYFRNGVLLKTRTVADGIVSGLTLYGRVQFYNAGVVTEYKATTHTNNNFADIGGTTKPESNADITRWIDGPSSILIEADYLGTPKAGQVNPRYIQFGLLGNAGLITSGVTWAKSTSDGVTATIDSTGKVNITGCTSSGSVTIQATPTGGTMKTKVLTVDRTVDNAPPPSGGGTSQEGSISGSGISTSMVAVSDELEITAGSAGNVQLTAFYGYQGADNSIMTARWYEYVSGSWTAIGSDVGAENYPYYWPGYYPWEPPIYYDGSGECNYLRTGIGAGTVRKFKLYARVDTPTAYMWGNTSGTGS